MGIIEITLPKMGESVAEATILKWLKQPGESIEKDETLVEIGTDKVESDLPSEYEGVVTELLVQEGDVVDVGQVIARMEVVGFSQSEGEKLEVGSKKLEAGSGKLEVGPRTEAAKSELKNSPVFLSPVVRKMAIAENISLEELTRVKGSGSNSRISKKDLHTYIESKKPQPQAVGFSPKKRNLPIAEEDTVETLSRMRLLISNKMLEAVNTIPHVTTFSEVDVTGLKNWRDAQKESFLNAHGTKLTYTHIMMYEVVQALADFPRLNAWLNGADEFIQKKTINLGFATSLPDGNLIVPNIKKAQTLDLVGLTKAVNSTADQARTNTLSADAIQNTTFTVSNTGKFGSLMGTPIIAVPQVAVIALGEIHRRPLVYLENEEEKFGPRDCMMLSISYDHRVINGAYAASFLKVLKKQLEVIA